MGATKSLLSYHDYIPHTSTGIKSSMEAPADPTDTDEASIPTESESTMSCTTTTLKRTAAKRTCFTLSLPAANILAPPPEEDIPARKKLCPQASRPAIVEADADTLNASPDPDVAAPVASPDTRSTYLVAASPMQPNVGAARAPRRRWKPEEDTKLTTAVKTTCKKKFGDEYRTDWFAAAALVPGRTKQQCESRWDVLLLACKGDGRTTRVGKWTTDEDNMLKAAVKKHYGKDWAAIAALVSGRTRKQCSCRWHEKLRPKTDGTTARSGSWTTDEDSTLKDAVEKHKGKNWDAISALVSGRTKVQCNKRWHENLRPKTDETTTRTGRWTADEDNTLKDAVEKLKGEDWAAITALVPGRTIKQCSSRWHDNLRPQDRRDDHTRGQRGNR
jgi:hypothetical protein